MPEAFLTQEPLTHPSSAPPCFDSLICLITEFIRHINPKEQGTLYFNTRTVIAMSERWPSPTDPIAFESLCADLWGTIWGEAAHKNGRTGQPQAGVDIYGKHGGEWTGIQCKQKDELLRSKLTPTELAEEVASARRFVPPLK